MKIINKTISVYGYFSCLAWQGSGSPLVDKTTSFEKEGEKRIGDSILIRLPFMGNKPTVGLVLGKWRTRKEQFAA